MEIYDMMNIQTYTTKTSKFPVISNKQASKKFCILTDACKNNEHTHE